MDRPSRPHHPRRSTSLLARAVAYVERRIIDGRYPVGQRLVETEIAVRLGISRTPVREAFRVLATDGLVTYSPRRGAIVKAVSRAEATNLYDIRMSLELLALRLAIPRMTATQLRHLTALHREMGKAVGARDVVRFQTLDDRFHLAICDASANDELLRTLQTLRKKIARLRSALLRLPPELDKAHDFHRLLLEAIESRDVERACVLRTQAMLEDRSTVCGDGGTPDAGTTGDVPWA